MGPKRRREQAPAREIWNADSMTTTTFRLLLAAG
jgi:hypothetical protein